MYLFVDITIVDNYFPTIAIVGASENLRRCFAQDLAKFSEHVNKTVSPGMACLYLGDKIHGFIVDCGPLGRRPE